MRFIQRAGLAAALLACQALSYEVKTPPLDTPWTYKVGENPWPEYPRPLIQRPQWKNLNGVWKWRAAEPSEAAMAPVNEVSFVAVLVPLRRVD